jgi:hypothetical protein
MIHLKSINVQIVTVVNGVQMIVAKSALSGQNAASANYP